MSAACSSVHSEGLDTGQDQGSLCGGSGQGGEVLIFTEEWEPPTSDRTSGRMDGAEVT